MCSDCPDCPECDLEFIHVEQLDQLHTVAVVAQNTINQLPSEDQKRILTELFGAFEFDKLNQKLFSGRDGKFFLQCLITHKLF